MNGMPVDRDSAGRSKASMLLQMPAELLAVLHSLGHIRIGGS